MNVDKKSLDLEAIQKTLYKEYHMKPIGNNCGNFQNWICFFPFYLAHVV